jgi:uncharacterized protein
MTESAPTLEGPKAGVTLSVTRRPRPGQQAAFESWIHDVIEATSAFPGHQGASVVRPAPGRPEYLILVRFATPADLQRWRSSEACREWVAKADAISEGPAEVRELHGLEAWFEGNSAAAPPRWKMAVLTWIAIYPALILVSLALAPVLGTWPMPLRLLLMTLILVPLMTWVLMPALARAARRWLH